MAAAADIDLSVILDAIPAPVFYKNAAGRYIGCNSAFEKYLGKSREEIIGKNVFELSPKEVADVYKAADDALFESGGSQIYEARVLHADGTYHDVVFHKATFKDANGRLAGLVGTILDITARKQTENSLGLFRALIDHSTDTFEVIDPASGRILDVNENGCRELGYTREEYTSLTVFDIDPLVDRAQFAGEPEMTSWPTWEGLHRRKDGSTFPVEVNLKRVRLDREYIVAAVRNISERKRVESEHLKFMLGVARSSDAIFLTDRNGTITYVNPAFESLYGFSKAEAVGKNPRIVKSGEQAPGFYDQFWRALVANQVVHSEMVNKTKDGRLVHVDATANPIVDAQGVTIGFLAIQRDITERKHAAEARGKLEEQLRASQKMEAIGRLAGGVAHDFNNILSVVLSFTGLLLEDLRPRDPMRADLEEVKRAGERASLLTGQLLAFSRTQVLDPRPTNLNEIVIGMEAMLRRLVGEQIELSLTVADRLGNVYADPNQIEQVVMNLVVNARDAMPNGGRIAIETKNVVIHDVSATNSVGPGPGHHVLLTVSDDGLGMDDETSSRIFEPFFTTKEKGKGTGLGLAMVFGIVQQSGGHIEVRSAPNEGATFAVYLPRTGRPVSAITSVPPPMEDLRGSETILLVDDDDPVRAVARAILRRQGYSVLEAQNAGEAFLICEQSEARIHLLLTDMVMPRMSGRELAARLVRIRPEMKVLFMTGYADYPIARDDILRKPITPEALARKVRAVLSPAAEPNT